ncbi:phosphatase PAP2 family protein [Salipaludibacillus aurantiacus]|uniref:Undecaprenyl-diphosphatase n=1 Tax=Salipaludibacillus aurantiacus TaxID=1601833 RepID=A0A1H9QA86_9BACI|nr:phosphatase PAP2 family protein [Salipaludibacillus aurantiacus]SER57466.1 undecaprenyl-diphosphatase [Salipaludibacillus aurantiacus]
MEDNNKKNISIALSCFILFAVISVLTLFNRLAFLDETLTSWLTEGVPSVVVSFMEIITVIGSGEAILILTGLVGVFLLYKKMWNHAVFLIVLTGGGVVLNFILKILFQRDRPGESSVIEFFGYSLEIPSYSFPSGHAMRSVILFSFLIYLAYRQLENSTAKVSATVIFGGLIILVALSRIITGAHFPSDILAAAIISIAWLNVCLFTFRVWGEKKLPVKSTSI